MRGASGAVAGLGFVCSLPAALDITAAKDAGAEQSGMDQVHGTCKEEDERRK